MPSRFLCAAGLLLTASSALAQRAPATGAFVTRLGNDTIAVERYVVTRNSLEGDVVRRTPRVQLAHYSADLGPHGEITKMVITTRLMTDTAGAPPRMFMTQVFSGTGASVTVIRNGRADTAGSGTRAYVGMIGVPNIMMEPASYGVYEQILKTTKLRRDSVGYVYVSANGGAQPSLWLLRKGFDSVAFNNTVFPYWVEMAKVDMRGRILAVNAGRTTVKTIARRVPGLDINAIAMSWGNYEKAHGPYNMSPTDTTRALVAGANIEVIYSRPSKRGRKIFGGDVVPYGQVWRTGANAATQLTTSSDIVIGGTPLPAGKYTLFTIPTAAGATLIISRKTGEWGTDYDTKDDFARLPLSMKTVKTPVEKFTIGVFPRSGGGTLTLSWDDREYSIPFTAK